MSIAKIRHCKRFAVRHLSYVACEPLRERWRDCERERDREGEREGEGEREREGGGGVEWGWV